MKKVDFFHIGPQKCATSWVYRVLEEHPQVACPPRDSVHYYDMLFHRGPEWYMSHFASAEEGQLLYDPTPSYIRSPLAAERIAADHPEAKIALCVRNPVRRAFSHYWHERKKTRFDYTFDELFKNYDLYASWVETAFYTQHIQRYLDRFPRERVLIQVFDDLEADPPGFLTELLSFLEVDSTFQPTVLHKKVNHAVPERTAQQKRVRTTVREAAQRLGVIELARQAKPYLKRVGIKDAPKGQMETLSNIDREVQRELVALFEAEIGALEALLERDLSAWRAVG